MIVTLDAFSGRPNPSWVLDENDRQALISRVAGSMLAADSSEVRGGLGFRGYTVSAASDDDRAVEAAGLPETFRIAAASLAGGAGFSADDALDAARWLLTTAHGAVEDDVLQAVADQMASTPRSYGNTSEAEDEADVDDLAASAVAACVVQNTAYNPGFWNSASVQPNNNCYNYSMNHRSDSFAQPGTISGHPNRVMQCADVATAANWDGCKATCSGPNKNVALVIWPGTDYHWYRRHSNGFWAHKPGQTAARNTDNSGKVIGGALSPANCDRGPYTIFCGYRYSPVGMKVR